MVPGFARICWYIPSAWRVRKHARRMRTPLGEEARPGALGGRLEKATGRELGGSVSKHDQEPRGEADRRLHGQAAAGLPAARAGCLAFIPADDPLKLSCVESIRLR